MKKLSVYVYNTSSGKYVAQLLITDKEKQTDSSISSRICDTEVEALKLLVLAVYL